MIKKTKYLNLRSCLLLCLKKKHPKNKKTKTKSLLFIKTTRPNYFHKKFYFLFFIQTKEGKRIHLVIVIKIFILDRNSLYVVLEKSLPLRYIISFCAKKKKTE